MGIPISDDNGGWLLAPRIRPYNDKERQDAQSRIDTLNAKLTRFGVAPAQILSDAPSPAMVLGRRISRTFGYDVTFIKYNRSFEGVAAGGHGGVSPNEKHPEVAVIGHEVLHSLKQTDKGAYDALSDLIRPYLKDGVVDSKRQWEDKHGGKNTTQAHAEEEILADLNGAMWLDPKFWREMAQNAPSLFRKVAYKFMGVATKAMNATSRFKADSLVTDVDVVRSIMAKTWAAQAQKANVKDAGDWVMPAFVRADRGSADDTTPGVLKDEAGKSMNVNAMPVSRKLMNVIDRKYQPRFAAPHRR